MTSLSKSLFSARRAVALATALAAVAGLGGCAVVAGGAMVGTALSATDRRSTGTQIEDQAIELKAGNRLRETLGGSGHVNVTSYNRTALITGEVASEADRLAVERSISGIEQLRATVNELAVLGNSSLTARSNDAYLTSKVKAAFIDAKDLQVNTLKEVTERGTVYLMGRVTEREAKRAAEVARAQSGVGKVVKVFELLTEAELTQIQTR